jgi:hypothetical protein
LVGILIAKTQNRGLGAASDTCPFRKQVVADSELLAAYVEAVD